ncbi:hypothetical protein MRX96_048866 [Rhipicephalus microplus]
MPVLESATLQTEPGKKKTVGDLVKEVEAQSAEDPDDGDREMSDDPDDSLLGLGDSFNILEYVDADQDRAFVGEGEKGNLLDKSLDLDVEEGDLEEVGCLETDSRERRSDSRGYWPLLLQEQLLPHEDLGKRKREQGKHGREAAMESLLSNVDLSGSRSTCSRGPPDESNKTPVPVVPPVALLHAMPQQHPVNPGQLVGNPGQRHHPMMCGPAPWPTSAMVAGPAQAGELQLTSQLPTRSEEPMVSPGGTMHLVRTKQGAMRVMGAPSSPQVTRSFLGHGGDQVRQHQPGHPYLQCSGDGTHPIMRLISEFGPPPKATTYRIRSLDPSR